MQAKTLPQMLEGFREAWVADHMEVTQWTTHRWFEGSSFPRRRRWLDLATLLRCTTKDIEAAYKVYRNGR
jgi:hypothetical protein